MLFSSKSRVGFWVVNRFGDVFVSIRVSEIFGFKSIWEIFRMWLGFQKEVGFNRFPDHFVCG